jgi:urea carboxylase-associated protein 2
MADTSTPLKAREHARAQAGTVVESMPTIPASSAKDLPPGVRSQDVFWDETIGAGGYASHVLPRGSRLRLTDLKGDACANVLIYNANHPVERLNVADTIKVQWNGYLRKGNLLLSDMGRVLMSIVDDTCEKHDTFCGASNQKTNAAKYGAGDNHTATPNARDRFSLALAKHGLSRRDIMPNVNFFKNVRIEPDGSTTFIQNSSKAGDYLELRAEMNVLIVVANTPHVLDPRTTYSCTPLRLTAWRAPVTPAEDPIRNATPENFRAFQNVDDYLLNYCH